MNTQRLFDAGRRSLAPLSYAVCLMVLIGAVILTSALNLTVLSWLLRNSFPAVVIAIDGEVGKGSARSIPGLDLFNALQNCQDCLESFGGHSMAAGLSIRSNKL